MSRKGGGGGGGEMSGKVDKQEASRNRGGRLARRARSFKEDLLERFTQMRSSSSARSASPNKASPHTKHKNEPVSMAPTFVNETPMRKNEKQDVHQLQKGVQFALKYFQDVVDKNTLEMLPGSATVVLETVLAILTLLKNNLTNEQSSLLMSTTNQVYQSLANLIRWADNILLHGDQAHNKENVVEIVNAVQEATKILVQFVEEKMHNKDSKTSLVHNGITSIKPESPKRTSLPDIPLTPREREILERTKFSAVDDNQISRTTPVSSDSFLHDSNNGDICMLDPDPPPKPPLPNNWDSSWLQTRCPSIRNVLEVIPPLPPKKKIYTSIDVSGSFQSGHWNGSFSPLSSSPHSQNLSNHVTDYGSEWSKTPPCSGSGPLRTSSSEWTSPLSVSPESVSPLSASASSLDSILNRSADDLLSTGVKPSIRLNSSLDLQTKINSCFSYEHSVSSSMKTWMKESSPAIDDLHQLKVKLQEFSCHSGRESSCAFSQDSGILSSNTSSSLTVQSSSCVTSSTSSLLNTSVTIHSSGKSVESKSETVKVQNSTSSDELWSSVETNEVALRLPPPPAIPPKKRTVRNRTPSQYDNVPDLFAPESYDDQQPETSSPSSAHHLIESQSFCLKHSESHRMFTSTKEEPPPLPPKKKHIMAYVQMIGNYSEPSKNEFFRHSMHTYNILQAQWQQQQCEMSLMHMRSLSAFSSDELSLLSDSLSSSIDQSFMEDHHLISPPALPPKRNRSCASSNHSRPSTSPTTHFSPMYELKEKPASMIESTNGFAENKETSQIELAANHADYIKHDAITKQDIGNVTNPLDEINVEEFLVYKKPGEEGPDIRGGSVDALIVHATKVNKNDFMYQEAFLTTYRTFITPLELTKKLLDRYNKYSITPEVQKQRAARNAFALLVRVVDDLCVNDIDDVTLQTLMDFVFQLLCNGDLILARALRKKILEKCDVKRRCTTNNVVLLPSYGVTTRQSVLLDFKSEHLAEQMTLLDADLFQKIEIPEVLIWAREQSEELSPNLTTFTEHFNKMSYWARSRILEQDDGKDREKYVVKFIKIMKHLRKLNNFNSYLAILSALDSAPIRRLEWQKHITEGLKEYCELIDSSSSFRAYRQALAETEPPCIPYIGLILQDLTFVHIGNSDLLSDGNINFSKRWQQFNILDNMRRFKKCNYHFKRHDRIIAFFNNFDDYLCEEAMWQISESIKPRG